MTWNVSSAMSVRNAASAYARVNVETGVEDADPLRLVLMLYDGALARIAEARGCIQRRDPSGKGRALGKAIEIVQDGLVASLDEAAGGELALRLRDLYKWIEQRLVAASVKNDTAALEEAARLLGDLRGAWQALADGGK